MQQSLEIDFAQFQQNRAAFPDEKLRLYHGKHVAWNGDATCILASGCGYDELLQQLQDLDIDPLTTVFDFIHEPQMGYQG